MPAIIYTYTISDRIRRARLAIEARVVEIDRAADAATQARGAAFYRLILAADRYRKIRNRFAAFELSVAAHVCSAASVYEDSLYDRAIRLREYMCSHMYLASTARIPWNMCAALDR